MPANIARNRCVQGQRDHALHVLEGMILSILLSIEKS